ncbi:MAG: sulfate adenylyltransferase subunit CysN [Chloroflexales bacterium]|nr:sulfate adenylyltransferase subunit CysN [Chloroflexales bacterium]
MSQVTLDSTRSLLRFLTCGSVDDGKSTLIGRLLYDAQLIFEDQLRGITIESQRKLGDAAALDLSLLVDGLQAEREQGITIDVAYRFFSTAKRRFIVADTPGHEQYTRNMATGASTADLAVLLVDARKGLLVQTHRHSCIASLLGIRHVVLAINKMDLVDFDEQVFRVIETQYREFARQLNFTSITAIPLSALNGDNVFRHSNSMPWYQGSTFMSYLEDVDIDASREPEPFRMPVQWVNRPHQDFRGFSGTISGGTVTIGDQVRIQPMGTTAQIQRIAHFDGDKTSAVRGEAVTLVLDREVDVSRGAVICSAAQPASVADRIEANVMWMHESPAQPGRQYLCKLGTSTVPAVITKISSKIDVNTMQQMSAEQLEMNEIGICVVQFESPIPHDIYTSNRQTGGFIFIDRVSNETVAAGMIINDVNAARNITWQQHDVSKATRSALKNQKPGVLWLTGLSGAGKSTIANLVERILAAEGKHTYILDGDNIRHGLSSDLGFAATDRIENIRRVSEVARLLTDAGLIVIVSLISPYQSERDRARRTIVTGEFIEVFIDTSLAECERRDPKGLYRRARAGEIRGMTGIDSPYEAPINPEIHIETVNRTPEKSAILIVEWLRNRGHLHA